MRDILGLDRPWPLLCVLEKLDAAAVHLLNDHDCDGHGWEETVQACGEARHYAQVIRELGEVAACPQPIKTAPRDRFVLLWDGERWRVGAWATVLGVAGWYSDDGWTLLFPTHWMLLPPGPEVSDG